MILVPNTNGMKIVAIGIASLGLIYGVTQIAVTQTPPVKKEQPKVVAQTLPNTRKELYFDPDTQSVWGKGHPPPKAPKRSAQYYTPSLDDRLDDIESTLSEIQQAQEEQAQSQGSDD